MSAAVVAMAIKGGFAGTRLSCLGRLLSGRGSRVSLLRIRQEPGRSLGHGIGQPQVVESDHPDFDVPELPLHEFIFQGAAAREEKVAVECGRSGKKWTYRDLIRRSRAFAASLIRGFKLKSGDRFAVVLPNCPEYPAVLLAGSMTGIVPTTVNPSYTAVEIFLQLRDANARLVVTTTGNHPKCLQALALLGMKIPIVVVEGEDCDGRPEGAVAFEELAETSVQASSALASAEAAIRPRSDVLVLPYSSGTSGLPKGVQLTHSNVVANLLQYREGSGLSFNVGRVDGQRIILGVLPMFHIYGMVTITLDALGGGDRLISLPRFEPDLFVDTIFKKQTRIVYLVPPLVFFLSTAASVVSNHLSRVEHVVVGAAPCGGPDLEKLLTKGKHLKITQGYGMTETSPVITVSHPSRLHKFSSVGHPLPSTFVKVTSVETGESLAAGQQGEICIKGPQVMKGYHDRPDETGSSFDCDGWLKTGDIGYYDDEHDFYVVDRMKELIKVKGFQVAPAELEEFMRGHPKVGDVAVVGVDHPDFGEAPRAFVVPKEGTSCTEEEIKNYVKEHLSSHKHLAGGVEFLKEIPKSGSGKILRRKLKNGLEKKSK